MKVHTNVDLDEQVLNPTVQWRLDWLLGSGWSARNAYTIAERDDIDYKMACKLREQKDDEELLMKVLI